MVDAAEVGRFGTLRLMKSNEPDVPIASFPVDDETVTFGRNPDCSVRLYYAWVSTIHCKIIFEENKAFLQVLGTNGVVVDGCQVVPDTSNAKSPTTVPLLNGSTIEIYKKRFQFSYPPKDLRPMLLMTPHNKRRVSLRLSMIQSAQVFSPRPSPNPQENLRILQSPLKPFVKTGGPDDVIKLVDGNHPKVVEEDQDLVIMETVESQSSRHVNFVNGSSVPPQPPRTPRRRSAPSLHRAVLLRSAQRAAEILEAQQQSDSEGEVEFEYERSGPNDVTDEEEEEEVEEAVSADLDDSDPDEAVEEINPFFDGANERETYDIQSDEAMEEIDEEQDITDAQYEHVGDLEESDEPDTPLRSQVFSRPPQPSTPVSKLADPNKFKQFMTPQPHSILLNGVISQGPQRPPPGGRYSLGGPQRVKISKPWKVADIVIEDSHVNPEIIETKVKNPDSETQDIATESNANVQVTNQTAVPDVKVDHSEDIRSMLAKMKDTVASMRRKSLASRKSLAGIGRGAPLTPSTKRQNEFSLLAPSPFVSRLPGIGRGMGYASHEEVVMEESGSQLALANKEESMSRNVDKTAMDVMESNEQEQSREERINDIMPNVRIETPSKSVKTSDVIFPKTPRMDGLREMFRAPRAPPATPLFQGMREMFRTQKEAQTPAYDGLRDMLSVPEAPEQEEDIVDAGIDDSMAIEPLTRPRRGRSKQETPNASTMADDEATPADFGSNAAKDLIDNIDRSVPKGAVVRKSRSRRAASSEREKITEAEDPAPIKPRGRSTKARGAKQIGIRDELEVSEESSNSETMRTVKASARRGRAAKSPLPQIQESEDMVVDDIVENNDQVQHSSTRQTKRRGAAKVKEETTGTETESVEVTQPIKRDGAKKTVSSGSKAKSSAPSKEISMDADVDMDDDPLDSIERPSSPEVQAAPITKSRRGRAKAAVMTSISEEEQPRRKAITRARAIKSEPEDVDTEALSEQSIVAKPSTRKGATKQSISKNAVLDNQNYGKENAPDGTIGTEESAEASKSTKTKTVRSRTTSKATKTTEEAAPVQRQTRARRVK